MRRALLCCALLTVAVAACSSGASSTPYSNGGPPDDHHRATYAPASYAAPTWVPQGTHAPIPTWGPAYTPAPTQAPPNPATTPYDTTSFAGETPNPYTRTSEDNVSTFGLDVDTASYAIAQRFVADGHRPDPASVRVEEWVNYFDGGYAPPETGTFAIHADGGPSPFLTQNEVLLRIGVKAREMSRRQRPAAALTFVIDVSGSMDREDRLELVKRSLRLLVEQLRGDDRVAIVVFSDTARVALYPTSGNARGQILAAIESLRPENSTNAASGLQLGYQLAREQEGVGVNRIILCTDGVANVGNTDAESILAQAGARRGSGIQLVAVGVGMGNYNDVLLEDLADKGDGFYAYVNNLDDARKIFVDELTTTIETVAIDAKAQIAFDPSVVVAYRLIGYENRGIADNEFRDRNAEGGALGAGHSVTALYALVLSRDARRDARIGTVTLRWSDPEGRHNEETARDVEVSDLATSWGATSSHFKLAALVGATAEVLKGSPWIEGHRCRDLRSIAREIGGSLPKTAEVAEFLAMLDRLAEIGS